jgi:multisubunit Na+/H+ antiporter MnhE subunit
VTRSVIVTLVLLAVYLLALTSVHPGDVLVGVALGAAIAAASRRAPAAGPLARRLAGVPALALTTLGALVRGTWHVGLFTLRPGRARPGLVAIPRGPRTTSGVAAWSYLTALAPDELVVDVDEARGVLLVHVLDASDPEAVRRRHADAYARQQARVFP